MNSIFNVIILRYRSTDTYLSPISVFCFVPCEESSIPATASLAESSAMSNVTKHEIDLSNSNDRKTSKTPISDKAGINNNIVIVVLKECIHHLIFPIIYSLARKNIKIDLTDCMDDEDDFMPDKKRFRPPSDSRVDQCACSYSMAFKLIIII